MKNNIKKEINALWAIFLGGMLGALARFQCSIYYLENFEFQTTNFIYFFPFDILLINILGSFGLGALLGYFKKYGVQNCQVRNFFGVGFLGAFTTFSTFVLDSIIFLIPYLSKFNFIAEQDFFITILEIWITLFPMASHTFLIEISFVFFILNIFSNLILCFLSVFLGFKLFKLNFL